jgi:5'-3' exonuclease
VGPSDTVYAAFDGIAPLGKMQQQQSRRYKSALMEKIFGKPVFSTLQITPGTAFMKYLSKYVNDYFRSFSKVIVSAADERGEGEHKIFQYIRDHPEKHRTSNTIIYGLDADLLMLSIFHSDKANLFVYREAPEFAKSLNADLNAGEAYVLNISELCVSICIDMGFGNDMANLHRRIHDYAVLCFLMGNDFLPKIPSLNIRTNGLQMIMAAYTENASKKGFYIIDENEKINWKNFDKILEYLEKREEANLIEEARRRKNYKPRGITDREKIEEIVRVLVEREEYVGVLEGGKRERERLMNEEREIECEIERVYEYYKYGLEIGKGVKGKRSVRSMRENLSKDRHKEPHKEHSKELSKEPHKEHSKELSKELSKDRHKEVSKEHSKSAEGGYTWINRRFILDDKEVSSKDFTEEDQLKYIMPIEILKEMGIEKEWDEEVSYEWAYCDYFWEADVIVTRIPLNKKS